MVITDFLLVFYQTLKWDQFANTATGVRCRPCYCLSKSTFIVMKQSFIQQMFLKHHPYASSVLRGTLGNQRDTVHTKCHHLVGGIQMKRTHPKLC